MTGIHRDTILRLLVRTGDECQRFVNEHIKHVQAQQVQVDEIWTYVFKKQARISVDEKAAGIGDQYIFAGIDSDNSPESDATDNSEVCKKCAVNADAGDIRDDFEWTGSQWLR
jgi:hypothetical protein